MHILIVDDEERLSRAIQTGLTRIGYTCNTALSGVEALMRIHEDQTQYELMILDLLMPEMGGHDVCKQLRAEGVMLPILVLTAKSDLEDKTELLGDGADDYLEKPFYFAELAARVAALLRRPSRAIPTTLTALDIELNSALRTASRDGVPLSLTLKEFSLLEYFLHHPNQVVNREDLIAHVWDFDYESFSNVVDVHIKNLRYKLDRGTTGSILETIRGIGYCLRTEGVRV